MTDSNKQNEKRNKEQNEEVLSFEAITAEIGDVSLPVRDDEDTKEEAREESAPPDSFEDIGGTVMADAAIPAQPDLDKDEQDRINSRILTGCSPQTRHMYVEGFFCGALATVFMAPIVLRIGLMQYQPWFSYMAMLLAGGAAIWSISGLTVEEKKEGRQLCVVSAVYCFAVAVVAFLVRTPPSG